VVGLDQPKEMQHGEDAGGVDQAVQQLPAAAETADHGAGRGQRQWQHTEPGQKADGDEWAFDDVGADLGPEAAEVQDQIGGEVQAGVEEREQAEHAPIADQRVVAGDAAQWRHRQGGEQQAQRPVATTVGDLLHRVGAELAIQGVGEQPGERQQAGGEQRQLGHADAHRHQWKRLRSMPVYSAAT